MAYLFWNCRWHMYSLLMAYLLTLCIDGILLNHHLLSCSFAISFSLPLPFSIYTLFIWHNSFHSTDGIFTLLLMAYSLTLWIMAYSFIFAHHCHLYKCLFICHLSFAISYHCHCHFAKLCIKIWHIYLNNYRWHKYCLFEPWLVFTLLDCTVCHCHLAWFCTVIALILKDTWENFCAMLTICSI